MYAEPGKGAIHGAKDLRHGDVYLRLGLMAEAPHQHDLNMGIVRVYYGKVHLATAETTFLSGDVVKFE